ncbi:unnamed protein product [Closterium sp. NIES-53]
MAEAVAGVGAAGRLRSRLCGCNVQQDSSGSTAAPAGPSNRQQKQGQVAAGAAAGGATVAAGGSCNFLTVFRHPLLPSPHSHEWHSEREEKANSGGRSCVTHAQTPPPPPPFSLAHEQQVRGRGAAQ